MVAQIALGLIQLAGVLFNSRLKDAEKKKEVAKRINDLVDWMKVGAPNPAVLRKDFEDLDKTVKDEWNRKWGPGITPPELQNPKQP